MRQVSLVAANLKILRLSHSTALIKVSLKTKKLETLVLTQCSSLCQISEGLQLKKLKMLNIDGCAKLDSSGRVSSLYFAQYQTPH